MQSAERIVKPYDLGIDISPATQRTRLPKSSRTLTQSMRYILREQNRGRERILGINQVTLGFLSRQA